MTCRRTLFHDIPQAHLSQFARVDCRFVASHFSLDPGFPRVLRYWLVFSDTSPKFALIVFSTCKVGHSRQPRPSAPTDRIHMGRRSFTGPWTLVTGGSSLGEGSATMDQTYVPAGTCMHPWRTMMGTSVDGRFVVKRKKTSRLPHGIFPYAFTLFLNAFAGRTLRLWSLGSIWYSSV